MGVWARIALAAGALALVPLGVVGWAWWRSEAHLAGFRPAQRFAAAIPTDPPAIARGEHLARTRGCFSCHGKEAMEGAVFDDDGLFGYGRAVAPNLPRLARQVDAAALEAAIRQGIGHDGRALFSMPSFNFARMSDADVAALIAYLRAIPVREKALPASYLGWKPRWEIANRRDFAMPYYVERVPLLKHQADPRPQIRMGEYLAMTSCNECHGFGLRGDSPFDPPGKAPPDLAGAMGYDKAGFVTLMRTGKASGGRELRLMSATARNRFAYWSDAEIDAIYAYLLLLDEPRSASTQ